MERIGLKPYQWIKVDEDKCSGCGLCIEYCPRDVLQKDGRGYPFMKYRDDCWYCNLCSFFCPKKAVTFEEVPYLIK